MQHDGRRGEGARPGVPDARDFGWDDSLYRDQVPRQRRGFEGGSGPSGDSGGPGATGDSGGSRGSEEEPDGPPPRSEGRARRGGSRRAKPPRSRKRRVLRWFVLSLTVLILGTAGAGYLYYDYLNGKLTKDELNLGDNKLERSKPNAEGQTPLNILLLGSDSRNSERNVELGGARGDAGRPPLADVQMLMHVSADRSNMSVMSIPRDTRVSIPKCTDGDDGKVYPATDTQTINSSLQHGGPGCTVATWEELTGIPIDHFMMIDFAGVVDMADAVGGVEVCVTDNVHDPKSGLKLEKGSNTVKGEQALQWLRTRHGFEDGSDIGRAKAQHMYMSSMVRQLKAGTKLSDPNKLRKLAESATEALTVDKGIGSIKKLYDLGNDIKRVPTKRITMATMPWVPDPSNPAHVVPKEGEAEEVFSLIRNDVALDGKDKKKPKPESPPKPSTPQAELPVAVQNGTGTTSQAPVTGRAAELTEVLLGLGFTQATTDSTPGSQRDTVVLYPTRDLEGDALGVAKALGVPESSVKASSGVRQITLLIGADWREGSSYPETADPRPPGGAGDEDKDEKSTPVSESGLNGDDKSACMQVNPAHTW